jgi:hypothetical protein
MMFMLGILLFPELTTLPSLEPEEEKWCRL